MNSKYDTDFPIRVYTKKELALCYFPDSDPHVAVNHLMAWIGRNRELTAMLSATGYSKSMKAFSPRQVRAIVELLGEP